MSELVSVSTGRGNEPLAFQLIRPLTGLMVKRLRRRRSFPSVCVCPGPERLRLLIAPLLRPSHSLVDLLPKALMKRFSGLLSGESLLCSAQ